MDEYKVAKVTEEVWNIIDAKNLTKDEVEATVQSLMTFVIAKEISSAKKAVAKLMELTTHVANTLYELNTKRTN